MRYVLLALFSLLFISGCTIHSGYGYDYGYYYTQPVPVYYQGAVYTMPHHYYHGQVIVTPRPHFYGGYSRARGRR